MSWFNYKPSTSEADTREDRRKKLEEERLKRAQDRVKRQQKLQAELEAQRLSEEAISELLTLDPSEVFAERFTEEEVAELLDTSEEVEIKMTNFEDENEADGKSALDKLGSVKCEFSKEDIEFWFSELEGQMEAIEVKSQWTKRLALLRFLPAEIKQEVKSLLVLQKADAGDDIYKRIKSELIDLFGSKPEDAYVRAKNRVMTGKPSQLGKALVEDICKCKVKLSAGCCARIVWGMYQEALPVVIRNHIAEMEFNKDTYKKIFQKSDQIYDSNKPSQPPRGGAAVAAVVTAEEPPEVAALKPQKANRGGRCGYRGGRGGGRGAHTPNPSSTQNSSANPPTSNNSNKGTRHPTAKGDSEKLCKIHFKWGENGSYCAAPWKCPMKAVYRAPQ